MVIAGWCVIGLYTVVVLVLAVRGAQKTKNLSDYATGSIAFSPVAVGLSLAASTTSAATFIINPGLIALYGISGVIALAVVLPIALFFSLVILTKGFRRHGTAVQAKTLAQWIGARYQSKGYAVFIGLVSLLLITFIVLICVGLTKIVSRTLDISELAALIGIVVLVFGYTAAGGANSMVYTNAVQAILMAIVAVLLLGSGYEHFAGGVRGFLDQLSTVDPNLSGAFNTESPLFRDFFEVVLCTAVIGVAIICQPHILTKSLLLKGDRDTNVYLGTSIVVMALFFLVVIAGLYARLSFPDLMVDGAALAPDSIMATYVVHEFPVWAALIVALGLISAGLSTLEGLIQTLSTTITSDVLSPLVGRFYPRFDDYGVPINRVVIVVLGVVSVWVSWGQLVNPDLSVAILAQNGVYAFFAAAFVPVLFGTFIRTVPAAAPIAASVTALVVHFSIYYGRLTPYMQEPVRNPAVPAAIAIVSSVTMGAIVLGVYRLRTSTQHNDAPRELDNTSSQRVGSETLS